MAEIVPFKGLLYDLAKVGDLALVTAPPYDVISRKAKPGYYARHPRNVVRLELGPESPADESSPDLYQGNARALREWQEEGVLVRDAASAYYFYRVDFPTEGGERKVRRGFFGLCRLEEFGKGKVFPHERIHTEQKEDRLKILRTCQANLSPIFSLFSDPGEAVYGLFESAIEEPLYDFVDQDDMHHTFWAVHQPPILRRIEELMREKIVLIADGHHRYQASFGYMKECEARGLAVIGREPFHYIMMYLCSFEDSGLTILPSHRLFFPREGFNGAEFEARLAPYFDRTDFSFATEDEPASRSAFFETMAEAGREANAFGLVIHGNPYYTVLQLKRGLDRAGLFETNVPPVLQKLDVVILHRFILDRLLGMKPEEQDLTRIQIIKNGNGAVDLVRSGRFPFAFLLNPPRVGEVEEVASQGEYMPQKSTFFYPKVPSGLVFNLLTP